MKPYVCAPSSRSPSKPLTLLVSWQVLTLAGESLLLPLVVESSEMALLLTRTRDTTYRFVVIQTDPVGGLRYHAVSPAAAPPKLKYRTCLVLHGVPKKSALDNVFWMAVYNLALNSHVGDTHRFYDVLLPFLTGKPLEASLVEAMCNVQLRYARSAPNSRKHTAAPAALPARPLAARRHRALVKLGGTVASPATGA